VLDRQILELAVQNNALGDRRQAALDVIASERKRLENQIAGTQQELVTTSAALEIQSDVEDLSVKDLDRITNLSGSGYAPRTEVDRRKRQLLADRAALLELRNSRERLTTTLYDLRSQLAALSMRQVTELASLTSEEGALGQRLSELELAQRQSVRASVNGTVSYQAALVGQMVEAGRPLVAIIPDDVPLEAYIYVPTKAAGFMRVGQRTRLRVQAFPYQRFGFVEGEIRSIARSVSPLDDPSLPQGLKESVYRVRVRLKQQSIGTNGVHHLLQAGMLLTADVETDRRRLWQQLFDPLIAAGKLSAG
jgi:membrane fusion protein